MVRVQNYELKKLIPTDHYFTELSPLNSETQNQDPHVQSYIVRRRNRSELAFENLFNERLEVDRRRRRDDRFISDTLVPMNNLLFEVLDIQDGQEMLNQTRTGRSTLLYEIMRIQQSIRRMKDSYLNTYLPDVITQQNHDQTAALIKQLEMQNSVVSQIVQPRQPVNKRKLLKMIKEDEQKTEVVVLKKGKKQKMMERARFNVKLKANKGNKLNKIWRKT